MQSPLTYALPLVTKSKLSILPIIPSEKRPGEFVNGKWQGMSHWDRYSSRLPTDIELTHWQNWPNAGVGIPLGPLNSLVALDFDTEHPVISDIEKIIPPSQVKKRGARGYTAFYRYNGEQSAKWLLNGDTIIELLSTGRQTLLPPSLHPNGKPYEWLTEQTLFNFSVQDLPMLPSGFASTVDAFFRRLERQFETTPQVIDEHAKRRIEDIKRALTVIPPDNYHEWIQVGMALYSEFPDSVGLDIWDEWSQKSAKYKPFETPKKWVSFRHVNDVTLGSLFYLAEKYGLVNSSPTIESISDSKLFEAKNLALPETLILECPGLVGNIAQWINETSLYRLPALSLAASLAAVGALKAHRVRSETNLRTNLYTLGICDSGGGKNHAIERITELVKASGLMKVFGGKPKSETGLLKSLHRSKGRRLILWDEMGHALEKITSKRSSVYENALLSTMMKLFSQANTHYIGDEGADLNRDRDRFDLEQPCLCIYGASTPETFYQALGSQQTVDGFLSRWLVFEPENQNPERKSGSGDSPPQELIARLQRIDAMPINAASQGNLDATIKPKPIFFTTNASDLLEMALTTFDKNRRESPRFKSLWARAGEHSIKLALTVEDLPEISTRTLEWSLSVVTKCIEKMIHIVEHNIADSDYERALQRVYGIIRDAGPRGLSRSELVRRTQSIPRSMRNDILQSLVEAERIIQAEFTNNSRKKTASFRCISE